MNLNHSQKKYIKKNFKKNSISEMAISLKLSEKDVAQYIEERWGKQKLQKHSTLIPQTTQNSLSFKSFLKNHWLNLTLLLFLVLVTFTNALNNAFLSDDLAEIVQNPNIGNLSNITSHPFGVIRPFLYWVVFHIGGLNQILFRSINLGLHLGNVFLVYILFNLLFSKRISIFVAAIFAVHPAISEAIIWISGGLYPQYTFFFLLSFVFYILSSKNVRYYWLSVLSFMFSLMSHSQMSLALIVIFPLYEVCFGNFKKNFKKSIPFFIMGIAYAFIIFAGLPERETTLQSVHYQERGVDNPLVLVPVAVSSYLQLTFFPKTLTLYHSELAFGPVEFAIRAFITLIFFAGLLLSFKKSKKVFFWSSFFIIALSPTLTPFRLNWIVAERYLYLPILGLLALTAFGVEKLSSYLKLKWLIYAVLAVVLIALSARTIVRNIDWKNEDNLWIATGKTSPSSPNTHNNLGDVYGRQGDKQRALQEFQKAVELKPDYGDGYHNLANTYRELGQTDKALENYQNALKFNPNLWQSYQNIAAIYFQEKMYDKALENIQKAIEINPKSINLRLNLGIVYLGLGDKAKAKEVFNLVLSADPENQFARQGLTEANK